MLEFEQEEAAAMVAIWGEEELWRLEKKMGRELGVRQDVRCNATCSGRAIYSRGEECRAGAAADRRPRTKAWR